MFPVKIGLEDPLGALGWRTTIVLSNMKKSHYERPQITYKRAPGSTRIRSKKGGSSSAATPKVNSQIKQLNPPIIVKIKSLWYNTFTYQNMGVLSVIYAPLVRHQRHRGNGKNPFERSLRLLPA
ncbi:unnamed protein product [Nesidiocoris tenuis]|uniref:Uncharacterized protein n=1 Tax=Nesidiocoris tenuis TaxID=355587 RepID=A0A6H5GGF3_9HEMI|nr:unnamed protein product [Nesidiocoris tenuis]